MVSLDKKLSLFTCGWNTLAQKNAWHMIDIAIFLYTSRRSGVSIKKGFIQPPFRPSNVLHPDGHYQLKISGDKNVTVSAEIPFVWAFPNELKV